MFFFTIREREVEVNLPTDSQREEEHEDKLDKALHIRTNTQLGVWRDWHWTCNKNIDWLLPSSKFINSIDLLYNNWLGGRRKKYIVLKNLQQEMLR